MYVYSVVIGADVYYLSTYTCIPIGTAYGSGDYFAVQAEYSADDRYSCPDNLKHKHIFQVQVLTGKSTKGDPKYRQAPKIKDSETDRYDSCVDNPNHPIMFIIFRDFQAYPAYLITFTKTK